MTALEDFDFSIIKNEIFDIPNKNINNTYLSKINTDIEIILPKSIIIENNDKIIYSFKIDDIRFIKLIELLNLLDETAINVTLNKTINWFNKDITLEKIQEKYNPIYNLQEENIVLIFDLDEKNKKCNITDKLGIKIYGLEFYKNKFKYLIKTHNLEIKKELDFSDIVNSENNKLTNKINEDMINDLAMNDTDISINTCMSKKDLESIIHEKRNYTKQCFIQAEKIGQAAENLRLKAIESINELKNYEKTYENYS